jgi:hypothetical protein
MPVANAAYEASPLGLFLPNSIKCNSGWSRVKLRLRKIELTVASWERPRRCFYILEPMQLHNRPHITELLKMFDFLPGMPIFNRRE